MPTYRYECGRCGRIHEYFQSINEEPKKKCPDCGGRLTRLIGGGAGVILKGSGFHNTDYRSPASQAARREESAPKADSKKNEGKKPESAPKEKKGKGGGPAGGEGAKG